ncbi:MAG TPA: protocatechuate 3,4-dioxygenase [Sphingomicrobium sp.]|nr:protocatechuate 3,4-dioxygenase [Sphingomicrobium sp.]
MLITRRNVIVAGSAATLSGIAGIGRSAAPTSPQELGPFYPVHHLADVDADLTRVRGRSGNAKGMPINVLGRLVDMKGNPVPNARLELWQANAAGRYLHPGDASNPAPIDPDFQGFAMLRTDRDGRFKFRSVKPGAYPIGGGRVRTPHIHMEVIGRNEKLITQMYFPGEELNAKDIVFAYADPKESVVSRAVDPLSGDPGALAFAWDIILAVG